MLGHGALGEHPLGGFGANTFALTSDILQDVITRRTEDGTLRQPPARLHHYTSLNTAQPIIEGDSVRLSHAEYSKINRKWSRPNKSSVPN